MEQTLLYNKHSQLGAKISDFAGFEYQLVILLLIKNTYMLESLEYLCISYGGNFYLWKKL